MDADFKKINQSAEKLRLSADRLHKFHSQKKKLTRAGQLSKRDATKLERLEAQFVSANVAVQEVLPAAAAAAQDPIPFEFGDFFKKVADGFIRAQQNLDAASAQYLTAVSKQPHALPSVFRIPRVAADVKFALEHKDGKSINLLFFKDENVSTTLNQQTVQFEIVSAPPPAGLLVAPVSAFPVLSKSRRAELFTFIKDYKFPANPGQTDQLLDRPRLVADPDAVIIVSVDGDNRFLLTVASNATPGNVGFWYLEINAQDNKATLAVIRKFGSGTDPNIGNVGEFIFKLGTTQKEFLAKLP